jgi:uncharacterized protein YndB with AHSA1/START domain
VQGRIDRAERWIAAPADRLFACWTDPAALARWLPPAGMTARVDLLDPRPGGHFRLVLRYDDACVQGKSEGAQDVVTARFAALTPPQHLAFVSRFESGDPQFQGEMRMDWNFVPDGAGTLVRIQASDVPPGILAEDHAAGMTASLAQLAAIFE